MTWLRRLLSLAKCPHEHSLRERDSSGAYFFRCVCCGHAVPALELDAELREKRGRLQEEMQRQRFRVAMKRLRDESGPSENERSVVAMTPRRRA